jgi:hypothetical protein
VCWCIWEFLTSFQALAMIRPWILTLAALGLVGVMVASAPAPQTQVSFSQLNDSEFINKKIRCVLDEAPCDAMGQKLKG